MHIYTDELQLWNYIFLLYINVTFEIFGHDYWKIVPEISMHKVNLNQAKCMYVCVYIYWTTAEQVFVQNNSMLSFND
jgi:hypothetical protein